MSLVEQAIARLRQSKAAAVPVRARPAARPARSATRQSPEPSPPSEASPVREAPTPAAIDESSPGLATAAPSTGKYLAINMEALRAQGYLPEKGADRQLTDNYRQIKRPVVERAAKGPATAHSRDPRVVMVTSALPGDGKTFSSINLSLSLARERDMSVLLVDADAPKPHVSEIFGIQHEFGLVDALVDENLDLESLIHSTNIRGFSLLPAGRMVEGAAELLLSNRMRRMLAGLLATNPRRLVVFDSAPLLITSEGRALLKIAGQTVLVVRAGKTPKYAVRDAVSLMVDQPGVGIILNEGEAAFTEGYYGYGVYGQDRT